MNHRYIHDCKTCVFLGQYGKYDLYACCSDGVHIDTVVGRYSDDGPDYLSGVGFRKRNPIIGKAVTLAEERGFILKEVDR